MSLDAALADLNARLKAGHHRCAVERRKASLVLRATLVDRSDPSTRRRQRLALGLPADYASLPAAEAAAVRLGVTLRQGTFTWADWTHETQAESAPITAADFRAAAERLHASTYRGSPERGANAWAKKWVQALRKLPPSGAITPAVLLRVITSMPAASAGRRDQGSLLAQVARSLGMDAASLQAACRGYGARQLTERDHSHRQRDRSGLGDPTAASLALGVRDVRRLWDPAPRVRWAGMATGWLDSGVRCHEDRQSPGAGLPWCVG